MASRKEKPITQAMVIERLNSQLSKSYADICKLKSTIRDLRATVITLTKRVEEQDVLLRKKPWWRVWWK